MLYKCIRPNIYKPLKQFVFSKSQCLNCHFHLQSQCPYRHSLLVLSRPMIYHPFEFSLPQRNRYRSRYRSRYVLLSIALLCSTKSTSLPFVFDFLFPFMKVGTWLHSYQNVFNSLVSSLVSTFVLLCLK